MLPRTADRACLALVARRRVEIAEQVIDWLQHPTSDAFEAATGNWDDRCWAAARFAVQVHGIGPWLHTRVAAGVETKPPSSALRGFLAYLAHCHAMNAERYRVWRHRLEALLAAAHEAGIALVAIKGAALLPFVWDDPVLRPTSDIDLLARADDRARLDGLCLRLGWTYQGAIERHRTYYLTALGLAPLDEVGEHPRQPLRLEIHEHAVQGRLGFRHDATDLLWKTSGRALVGDSPVLLPAPGAVFEHALVHTAFDLMARTGRLIKLRDLELLARTLTPPAWEEMVERASARDLERVYVAPLVFVNRYLAAPAPAGVMRELLARTPRNVVRFLERAPFSEATLCAGVGPGPGNMWWRRHWLRPGAERIAHVRRAFIPTRVEIEQGFGVVGQKSGLRQYYGSRIRRWRMLPTPTARRSNEADAHPSTPESSASLGAGPSTPESSASLGAGPSTPESSASLGTGLAKVTARRVRHHEDDRVRVAWILPGGVDESGVKRVIPALLWQIERLAARHELHVFALAQHTEAREYELLGAQVHSLPATQRLARWSALIRGLRRHGPFDVMHAFWASPSGLLAGLAGRLLRVPVLLSLGGGELANRPEVGYGGQLRWRDRVAVAAALRLAARRTVASHFMRTLVLRAGHDAEIVPLGVPPALFAPPATPPAHPPWRLLHVASINAVKDQRTLLDAMALIVRTRPDARLDIVGADTLNGAVHDYARSLGLGDFVRFTGWQASTDLAAWYRRAHLLMMSSRHEAGPVVALEAAACGVAVVGTRVGHIADWAPDGALAVELGDAAALASAVLDLIADEGRRACLASAARAFALAHDADWTAQRFEGLYRTLAA